METLKFVSYEMFGAKGDGITDDGYAIQKAHDFANERGLKVITNPVATYYIGKETHTATIMTDVDFGTSKFIIDDREVPAENRFSSIFKIVSAKKPYNIDIKSLKKNQMKLDLEFDTSCYIKVVNHNKKQFIRKGANQNSGFPEQDSFIVDSTGYILNPIIWDFEEITEAKAFPIDEAVLTVSGGIFTVIANQAESKYNYYARNIAVRRSNTVIKNITMYTDGEGDHGAPYDGFIRVTECAFFTLEDAFLTPRKKHITIGAAGVPVPMGSYAFWAAGVIGLTLKNVRQKNIMDSRNWGVLGSNYCKEVLVENCTLSRYDSHENVTNLTIRGSTFGWQGIQAIGHGRMVLENLTIYEKERVIALRGDYGSTWDGDIYFKNVRWYPCSIAPTLIRMYAQGGDHDYGYPCSYPHAITVENLHICDGNIPEGYRGASVVSNFSGELNTSTELDFNDKNKLFPHLFAERITLKNITTDSGRGIKIFSEAETAFCFLPKKHSVKDGKINPNFRACFENVEMPAESILPKTKLNSEDYGENHHLVPRLEFINCKGVIIDEANTPAVVKVTDCSDCKISKNITVND